MAQLGCKKESKISFQVFWTRQVMNVTHSLFNLSQTFSRGPTYLFLPRKWKCFVGTCILLHKFSFLVCPFVTLLEMIVDHNWLDLISFQEVAAVSVTNLRCLRGALPLKGRRQALQPRRPLIPRQTEAGNSGFCFNFWEHSRRRIIVLF